MIYYGYACVDDGCDDDDACVKTQMNDVQV
jgi:hypothetical protein